MAETPSNEGQDFEVNRRVPVPEDQVTPEMRAKQAQREQDAKVMDAAANLPGVPGSRTEAPKDNGPLVEGGITSADVPVSHEPE